MAVTTTNLGVITAYGDAVAAGYTGTKAEWQALMASYATVGQQAVDAKNDAVAAKNTAVSRATEATTAANTATTKANEASASAQSIAQSAAQIQENTDDIEQLKSDITDAGKSIEAFGIIEKPDGVNLLDVYYGNIEKGKYWNPTISSFVTDSTKSFCYVPVSKGKTYSLLGELAVFGTANVVKIPIFDNNKTFISHKWGTLDQSTGIVTLTGLDTILTENSGYAGYSYYTDNTLAFFVEGNKTTLQKINYYLDGRIIVNDPSLQNNVLYNKTAVFLGDSICAADTVPSTDTDYYKYGWAGRIGSANDMTWKNYGVSGGSITRITGRSCIQDRLVMAYADYPNADYFIFEGGTNDADVIEATEGYSKGTFEQNNFSGEYDLTTFCGSLETLIYNIINKYPDKKIGYIIPCKMGIDINALAKRRSYFDTAKDICAKWGVAVIDVWENSVMNPQIQVYYDRTMSTAQNISSGKAYVDGQHPTDVGYDIITPIIESWMKTI